MTWEEVKGRLDALNLHKGIFEGDNEYGIPTIKKTNFDDFNKMIPFGINKDRNGICHFFLDDYRFERVWNKPKRYLDQLKQYKAVLSPDFSLYMGYPYAVQLWNTYRNRWMGAYWQSEGITVIPTIGWSDLKSRDFCYEGVEKGSTVAVSSVGVLNDEDAITSFTMGFLDLQHQIEPKTILWYGKPIWRIKDIEDDNVIYFESFTTERFEGKE